MPFEELEEASKEDAKDTATAAVGLAIGLGLLNSLVYALWREGMYKATVDFIMDKISNNYIAAICMSAAAHMALLPLVAGVATYECVYHLHLRNRRFLQSLYEK